MLEIWKLLISTGLLILGFPIGELLARATKEELNQGRKYFVFLVWIGLIGGMVGLILGNDILLFSMFFIAIVTSRSLVKRKVKKRGRKN